MGGINMEYSFKIYEEVYNEMINGQKTIEIRLLNDKTESIKAYVIGKDVKELQLELSNLTDDERQIILSGCLINYYRDTK